MRGIFFLAIILLCTVLNSSSFAQSKRAWIKVGEEEKGTLEASLKGKIQIISQINEQFVVSFNREDLPLVSKALKDRFRRIGIGAVYDSEEKAAASIHQMRPADVDDENLRLQQLAPPVPFDKSTTESAAVNSALNTVSPDEIISTIKTLQSYKTRHYQSDTGRHAALNLQKLWNTHGRKIARFSSKIVKHQWMQPSIVATIQGTQLPNEIVVIGAHIDSINIIDPPNAPGADDDASGIAVITEVLRIIGNLGIQPKRTIQFIAYSAEEGGLLGSQAISRDYIQSKKNVISALQIDMAGHQGSSFDIYLIEDYTSRSMNAFLTMLLNSYNSSGDHSISYGTTSCGYECSDHASWTSRGVSAAMLFESEFEDAASWIHSAADVLARMDASGKKPAKFAKLALEYVIERAKVDGATARVVTRAKAHQSAR